jgi:two-component system NarL family sensor kinase
MYKWLEPQTIAIWIGSAFSFMLLLITSMVSLAYLSFKRISSIQLKEAQMQIEHQKKLLETSIVVQEEERTRIAADLHDRLIGRLAGIRLSIRMPSRAEETDRLLEESIAEARRISHNLSTPLIEYLSLSELIKDMLLPLDEHITTSYIHNTYTPNKLHVKIKVQTIRILQELLTNTLKHSKASRISIHIRHSESFLIFSLHDNGCGFNLQQVEKGLGLHNVELRVQYLQATYRIKSSRKKGSTTLIVIPLKPHVL